MLSESSLDVVSVDWTIDIGSARQKLGDIPVQGNLDPSYLFGDKEFIERRTEEVIESAGPGGHILNLGHGVHRDTSPEKVSVFVETAKKYRWH